MTEEEVAACVDRLVRRLKSEYDEVLQSVAAQTYDHLT